MAELQQLEYLRTKFETAAAVPEGTYSKRWIATNILGLSDSEFLRNQRETFYDRKYQQSLEALADIDALSDEAALGGDLGLGDDGLGGEGLEDIPLDGEELATPEAAPAAEESPLLATPARDEDNPTKHQGAPHKPVASDGRTLRGTGGRRRKIRKEASPIETNTWRTNAGTGIGNPRTRGGKTDVRFGLEEQLPSTYNDDEVKLLDNTNKVRRLVEEMEASALVKMKKAVKNET